MSMYEPWSELDDVNAPLLKSEHASSSSVKGQGLTILCGDRDEVASNRPPKPDTSRLSDGFSKLFLYDTVEERTNGTSRIVHLLHEVLDAQSEQRIRPEVVQHWTHLIHLNDTDFLHLTFFFLMLTNTTVVCKLAAMTDPDRFCRFCDWLIPFIQNHHLKLSMMNGRKLVHDIRTKWTMLC